MVVNPLEVEAGLLMICSVMFHVLNFSVINIVIKPVNLTCLALRLTLTVQRTKLTYYFHLNSAIAHNFH